MTSTSVNSKGVKGGPNRPLSNPSVRKNGGHNKLDVTDGRRSLLDTTPTADAAAPVSLVRTIARTGNDELRRITPCADGAYGEKSNGTANSRESHSAAVSGSRRGRSASASSSLGSQPSEQDHNNRRLPEARKSLVDRQAESLGWAAKPVGDAAAVVVQPRQVFSLRNGASDRRRASSPSAAHSSLPDVLMPSSTSAGFFGSFDDSRYWDYAFRFTQKGDMGHHCRECKRPFSVLNEAIAVRRSGDCGCRCKDLGDSIRRASLVKWNNVQFLFLVFYYVVLLLLFSH